MTPIEHFICRPFDLQKRYGYLWREETELYTHEDEDIDTVECAELADELAWHEILVFEDDNYEIELVEWWDHVYEHRLMLPLEQSCHEGILLPVDLSRDL